MRKHSLMFSSTCYTHDRLVWLLIGILKEIARERGRLLEMPLCCRCNGNGRCRNCCCVRTGLASSDCLPLHQGRCENPTRGTAKLPDVSSSDSNSDSVSFSEVEQGFRVLETLQGAAEPADDCSFPETLPLFAQIENIRFLWQVWKDVCF